MSSAATPTACGLACDVPPYVESPPPSPVDVMYAPGPSRSSVLSELEKHVTRSAFVAGSVQPRNDCAPRFASQTAPTDTALEMHAGYVMPCFCSWFPEATNVNVPTERSVLIADVVAGWYASQAPIRLSPLCRLMFTSLTSG